MCSLLCTAQRNHCVCRALRYTAGYAVPTHGSFSTAALPNALFACQKHAGMPRPAARRETGDANDAGWLVNMHVWLGLSTLICLMPASVSRQLCSLARFGNALCLLCVLCMQRSTSTAATVGSIDCAATCGLSLSTCSEHCTRCVGKIWLLQIVLNTQGEGVCIQ